MTSSCLVSTSITFHALLIFKKCQFLLEKILCSWLLGNRERPIGISSSKNGHFFNINGACKSIDIVTIHDVVKKTWKTSANNKSFSISQEPTTLYILKCQMKIFTILMVHAKLLMLIQDVKLG